MLSAKDTVQNQPAIRLSQTKFDAKAFISSAALEFRLLRAITAALSNAHKIEIYPSRLSSALGFLTQCTREADPAAVRKLVKQAFDSINIVMPDFEAHARDRIEEFHDSDRATLLDECTAYNQKYTNTFSKYDATIRKVRAALQPAIIAIDLAASSGRAETADQETDRKVSHAASTALILLQEALHD
ncbi:Uncharacterised protein [Candidatus Anstonella stagnisolia]|nr:Uncharacterised protein [Candidatus Anstonella stagnisolia]